MGSPKESQFTGEFLRLLGARWGAATINGTYALQAALLASGIAPGDEVIVPALTWIAPAAAALLVNAVPVFADVAPQTLCLDPASAESLITSRTRAIVAVHLYCCMADVQRLSEIAQRHSLAFIEDCAQAHGARWRERAAGTYGRYGTFSFQERKVLTCGEGGFIVSNDPAAHMALLPYINIWLGKAGNDGKVPGRMLAANGRISSFQAAVLLAQLGRFPRQQELRNQQANELARQLEHIPGISPIRPPSDVTEPSYFAFPIRYNAAEFGGPPLRRLLLALAAEGLPAMPGYEPNYRSAYFSYRYSEPPFSCRNEPPPQNYASLVLPVSEKFYREEGIVLTHNLLLGSEADIQDIVDIFAKIYEHREDLIAGR